MLKVVATVCVIFHHYQVYTDTTFNTGINFRGRSGWIELFFLLSGYFISRYKEGIYNGELSFKEFFVPKYLRFFMPRVLTVLLFAFLCDWYQHIYSVAFFDRTPTIFNVIQACCGFTTGWGLPISKMNGTVWYISVLLLCYVVFYLCVWCAMKLNVNPNWMLTAWIFIGFSMASINTDILMLNAYTAQGYTSFFWGVILAELVKHKEVSMKHLFLACFCFAGVAYFLVAYKESYAADHLNYLYTFCLWPPLRVMMESKLAHRVLGFKWISWLSKVPFEAYIWHFPLILLLLDVNRVFEYDFTYCNRWIQIGIAVVSYLVGIVCYYLVEKPGVSWLLKVTGIERE